MADFVIRDAALDDVPAISELIRRTVRLSNVRDYPAEIVELIAANHTPDKVAQRMSERDVCVCQAGHRVIGTVGLGHGKLRSLFVER